MWQKQDSSINIMAIFFPQNILTLKPIIQRRGGTRADFLLVVFVEFEKWRAIPTSVGGVCDVGGVLARVAWVACLLA